MGSKLLYIDNVTTDKYIKSYSERHKVNDKFTYITFSEYNRPVGNVSHWHGDIFFNGEKITYYNDVDSSYVVTDGLDNFIGYINNEYCVSVARAGIVINDSNNNISTNKYEIFNTNSVPNNITYSFVSQFENYINVSGGEWKLYKDGTIYNNNGDIEVSDNEITGSSINNSCKIDIAYEFNVEDKKCVSYAYVSVNNISYINKLTVKNFPKNLAYGTIYTPYIETEPADAIQREAHWTSDSTAVEILNTQTGTFRCVYPKDNINLTCTYQASDGTFGSHESVKLNVLKVNPHLSLSAWGTTYLWDSQDVEYFATTCYAHYDNYGFNVVPVEDYLIGNNAAQENWRLNNTAGIQSSITKTISICRTDLTGTSTLIRYILPKSYFYPYITAIPLYTLENPVVQTQYVNIVTTGSNTDYNTIDLVIEAVGTSMGMTDTNYIFDGMNNFDSFTVTNIEYDQNTNTTYTYVTASLSPNMINNAYINHGGDISADALSYVSIGISTTDESFISSVKNDIYIPRERTIDPMANENSNEHRI